MENSFFKVLSTCPYITFTQCSVTLPWPGAAHVAREAARCRPGPTLIVTVLMILSVRPTHICIHSLLPAPLPVIQHTSLRPHMAHAPTLLSCEARVGWGENWVL